ncbi:hypothetical protein CEXT_362181 [Caerostris extrusa]|uniref:Uncharacterized protein n=1 Tax=Caerostris extrusa TaxID=172846 RepID=A0AAV4P444_CAEEX|nr:hypothetical protein CEXT_362181 [Caerostris extrusa]
MQASIRTSERDLRALDFIHAFEDKEGVVQDSLVAMLTNPWKQCDPTQWKITTPLRGQGKMERTRKWATSVDAKT